MATGMARKAHSVATRVWSLHGDLHMGLVKSLRVLRQPGSLKRFELALEEVIIEKLEFAPAIPSDAVDYQQHTLKLFSPPAS